MTIGQPAGAQDVQVHTVLLAGPRAFCAGVERAIEIVERALKLYGAPVYVRRQIVHNQNVVSELETKGVVFVAELDEVPRGATVVYSAHGVAPAVRVEAEQRDLRVIDATCPLVTKVHSEARRFARRGDTIALIGHRGHDEVEGTFGEAPSQTVVVETAAEAAQLQATGQVSYLMETTLAVDEAAKVVEALRARFPDLDGPRTEDICYATTNRQRAVLAVAAESDVVLVVGSKNSANSNHLVDTVRRQGTPAYLIDGPSEIDPEWIRGARVIGLSAGASAPPSVVEQVIDALSGDGRIEIAERTFAIETVEFTLPREVRSV
jgi:4-hydroxy-3-methylbut-2-en-1-yl diphosphate reductase